MEMRGAAAAAPTRQRDATALSQRQTQLLTVQTAADQHKDVATKLNDKQKRK
jgi:hypothetical protein